MTQQKQHNRRNRARRIPYRIREIQTEINSVNARVAEIENWDEKEENKAPFIRKLRDIVAPLNAQLRRLTDGALELKAA